MDSTRWQPWNITSANTSNQRRGSKNDYRPRVRGQWGVGHSRLEDVAKHTDQQSTTRVL
jgi:hypothetical protein